MKEKREKKSRGRRGRRRDQGQKGMETHLDCEFYEIWYGTLDFCMETTLSMDFVWITWNCKASYD